MNILYNYVINKGKTCSYGNNTPAHVSVIYQQTVCLFVVCFGFFVHLEHFSLILRRHYYRWKAQILTYARHWWPLSSEGSLTSTPTVTRGIRLQRSSPRTSDTYTFCWTFDSGAVTTCFSDLGLSRLEFEHPTLSLLCEFVIADNLGIPGVWTVTASGIRGWRI